MLSQSNSLRALFSLNNLQNNQSLTLERIINSQNLLNRGFEINLNQAFTLINNSDRRISSLENNYNNLKILVDQLNLIINNQGTHLLSSVSLITFLLLILSSLVDFMDLSTFSLDYLIDILRVLNDFQNQLNPNLQDKCQNIKLILEHHINSRQGGPPAV